MLHPRYELFLAGSRHCLSLTTRPRGLDRLHVKGWLPSFGRAFGELLHLPQEAWRSHRLSILFHVGLYLRVNKEHVVEVIQPKLTIHRATIHK